MWCGFIGTRIWRLKRLRRYLSHQLSWAWRHLPSCLGESYGNILDSVRNDFQRKWKKSSQVYVDDLITGGRTVQETQHLKEYAQTISSEAQFELHKWHSNVPALEIDTLQEERSSEQESSYAKQQLGAKPGETKLLEMPRGKEKDTIAVVFPTQPLVPTKRELLFCNGC